MATDPNLPLDTKKALRDRGGPVAPPPAGASAADYYKAQITARSGGWGGPGAGESTASMAQMPGVANAGGGVPNAPNSLRVAPATAPAPAAAPAPATPSLDWNARPAESGMSAGERLPSGLRRYAMDAGNEATVYAGRGKHGEVVFTDQPGSAWTRANVAGGLRRGDVSADQFARTQGDRAGFAYGQNTLQRGGYSLLDESHKPYTAQGIDTTRALQSANDPRQVQSYMDALAAGSGAYDNPETAAADKILANQLRAKYDGLRQHAGSGAADTSLANLPPQQQIALMGLRTRQAEAQARLADSNERTSIARQNAAETAQNNTHKRAQDLRKSYAEASAQSPQAADQLVSSAIPRGMSPGEFSKWLNTEDGQVASDLLLQSMQRGAGDTLYWPEFGDKGALNRGEIDWSRMALDNQGQFAGFTDSTGSNEYPRSTALGFRNYNEGLLNSIPSSYWRVLRERADGLRRATRD